MHKIFKKYSLTFWMINLYILVLILMPKSLNTVFVFPINMAVMILLTIIFIYEYYKKKITLNNNFTKGFIIFYGLFLLATIPSFLVTTNLFITCYTFVKFALFGILFFIISKINFTKEEYQIFIKTFITSIVIVILIATIRYVFRIDLTMVGVNKYPGSLGRTNATFFNTIYYGLFVNVVFAFILYFYQKSTGRKSILLGLILIGLFVSMLLTFTRSSYLIFFGTIVILFIFNFKRMFNKKTIVLLLILLCLNITIPGAKNLLLVSMRDGIKLISSKSLLFDYIPIVENEKVDLEDDKGEFDDYSLAHRKIFAKVAKKIYVNNKMTGVGFGAYQDFMNNSKFDVLFPDYMQSKTLPHSSFILLLTETGILSFILFIMAILIWLFNISFLMFKSFKKNKAVYALIVNLIAIYAGLFATSLISENVFYDSQMFSIFIIVVSLTTNYAYTKLFDKKRVMFISSTGGHLNELKGLKNIYNNYDYSIVTEKTKSTVSLNKEFPNKVNYLLYGTKDRQPVLYIFKLLFNSFKSLYLYFKLRPEYIVTTGTHTAGPMCCIGKMFGSKIIYIETFANINTKTATGKLIYYIADLFIVQWQDMLKLYPKATYGGWIY